MAGAFTHRADLAVPDFDDTGHIVFLDGDCALCSRSARIIARADIHNKFKIATMQSALGTAIFRHYGLDPADPASWLYLEAGHAFVGAEAVLRAARHLSGPVRLLRLGYILPRSLREALYRFVARNRLRWFGGGDMCATPDEALKARLL